MRHWIQFVLCLSTLTVPTALNAQDRLSGTVRDTAGLPISSVLLRIPDSKRPESRTDSAGRFTFRGLPSDSVRLEVRRLGFVPLDTLIVLSSTDARNVVLVLHPKAVTLEAVTVTDRRARLPRVYDRIDKNLGAVLFAEDLPQYQLTSVDDLLKFVPAFAAILAAPERCGKRIAFLDGKRIPPAMYERMPPPPPLSDFVRLSDIEAVEVHKSADFLREEFLVEDPNAHVPVKRSIGPIQLGTNPPPMGLLTGSCRRIVLIWTKGYQGERTLGK